jgi:hypothetical protein
VVSPPSAFKQTGSLIGRLVMPMRSFIERIGIGVQSTRTAPLRGLFLHVL